MPAAVDKKALEETAGTSGCRQPRARHRSAGRRRGPDKNHGGGAGKGEPPGRRRSDRGIPVVCEFVVPDK